MIKFLDLRKQYESIKSEIDDKIQNVIKDSAFIGGKYLQEFEEKFAAYCGVKHCIGVGNGTDALEIAINAMNFPDNSEIIVPANSFIASSEAVSVNGHKVVFCDCDPVNYTISIESLKQNITEKTAAVIVVHLYGHACDMDEIVKIAKEHKLKVIEDCAQAQGTKYKNNIAGSFGDIATFSFYPGKNLGAFGDAGAIITNNSQLAEKCKMIKNHGRVEKYNHLFEGRNSRLDGLQAGILTVKLNHLDSWNQKRRELAEVYFENLKNIGDLVLPKIEFWCESVFYVFVIRTSRRDELQSFLKEKGIPTIIHYPIALPKLKAYDALEQNTENFVSNKYDEQYLSLPIGEHLNIDDIRFICNEIKNFFS